MEPKLTKLEYFALMIGAQLDSTYDNIWAAKGMRRAKLLIDEKETVMCKDDAINDAHKNDEQYDLNQRLDKLQAEHLTLHIKHSTLQREHLEWLNKYAALQNKYIALEKKYIALVEEDTKLTQELTDSLKTQIRMADTIQFLQNTILDRIDDASRNFALHVTIGAIGVLAIKFSIDFIVWMVQ